MEDRQPEPTVIRPAWKRVMDLPELGDMLALHFSRRDLASCCLCRDEGVIIPWLTRAALEGRGDHLQGLEIFQLGDIPKGLYTGGDPLGLNWEVFYQFLESLPRLREFSALQLKIAPDVLPNGPDILRINADILDNDSAHSTQATARRSQTLGLIKLALHSTTPNPRLETDQDGTGDQKDLAGLLARVPRLVQLQFQDVVVLDLITALNLRDERDNKYNSVVMSIREFGLNKYTRPPITLDPIVMKDWRNLVSSPMFRLETLDLLSREDVPGDLLDHITSSPSISTLRCVLMNRTIPQPAHRELTVYYQSIRQFLRSAPSLVEFMAPYTTFDAPEEFFTPQESARWPCRDTLKILKLHSVDLQESTQYSGELRRWLWSFKRLEEAEILGRGATVDVLIDPTFARPTSQELTALPLVMNRLQLPDILSTRITLAQVKDVVERVIPNLFYLEVGTYEPDAEAWLSEYHPDIHSYMSEMLFA
ncbi:hypothetical protein BGZ83_007526 [Gryganskiella cystojenkinii]|nr:hypothetical protein BGZ83_007526 [Gryganskiella cystojenkinii]